MDATSPVFRLDITLKFLKEDRGNISFDNLLKRLQNYGLDIQGDELMRIIDKLLKDKYVYTQQRHTGGEDYAISFDGWIFQHKGGYEYAFIQRETDKRLGNIEVARARWVDSQLVKNAKRLNDLTMYLAIGTVALLLWQIFLWYFPTHADYPLLWKCEKQSQGKQNKFSK